MTHAIAETREDGKSGLGHSDQLWTRGVGSEVGPNLSQLVSCKTVR